MTTTKTKAEAIKILTAPDGPCDPFAEGVKDPDLFRQIVKESMDNFVRQNPLPSTQSPEQLAEAFMDHMAQRKKAPR